MQIARFIDNLLHLVSYLSKLAIKEGFSNTFKGISGIKSEPLYILANGPSLKEFLIDYDKNTPKYEGIEYFVVNDFVKDEHFSKIRPKYCAMSDPLFFKDTIYSERGHTAMKSMSEKVKWEFYLFIPMKYKASLYLSPLKENPYIKIIPFHAVRYWSFDALRYWFYKKGLGNGEFGSVALNALYAALLCGYKEIHMLGIDHTFFDNIVIDKDNTLCYKDNHFFGSDSKFRPMLRHYGGVEETRPFTMAEFLEEKAGIFKGHEIMNSFAEKIGAKVYNDTKNSLVDAYPRTDKIRN